MYDHPMCTAGRCGEGPCNVGSHHQERYPAPGGCVAGAAARLPHQLCLPSALQPCGNHCTRRAGTVCSPPFCTHQGSWQTLELDQAKVPLHKLPHFAGIQVSKQGQAVECSAMRNGRQRRLLAERLVVSVGLGPFGLWHLRTDPSKPDFYANPGKDQHTGRMRVRREALVLYWCTMGRCGCTVGEGSCTIWLWVFAPHALCPYLPRQICVNEAYKARCDGSPDAICPASMIITGVARCLSMAGGQARLLACRRFPCAAP